jgi:predicted nucleic acid-binding protein
LKAIFEGFASGLFALLPLDGSDLASIAAILARYKTTGIQLADASLVHLADREGIRTVFTTDRRDFSIIRLKRNRALRLIPDTQ